MNVVDNKNKPSPLVASYCFYINFISSQSLTKKKFLKKGKKGKRKGFLLYMTFLYDKLRKRKRPGPPHFLWWETLVLSRLYCVSIVNKKCLNCVLKNISGIFLAPNFSSILTSLQVSFTTFIAEVLKKKVVCLCQVVLNSWM